MISRRSLSLALLLFAVPARGDKVDDLSRALRSDPSFRVKVQAAIVLGKLGDQRGRGALIDALRDDNEAVRLVAASALGRLGDRSAIDALRTAMDDRSLAVRGAAGRAIALLEKAPASRDGSLGGVGETPVSRSGRVFVEVAPIAAGPGGAEAAKHVRDRVVKTFGELGSVTLATGEAARARYFFDGGITNLSTTAPDREGHVRTDCDLRVVLATLPERSIKVMATVGGSVAGTGDPGDIASARAFCLDDAASQAVKKVQAYLESP